MEESVPKPTYKDLEQKILDLEAKLVQLKSEQNHLPARNSYHDLLDFLPYPVMVRDTHEIVTYINPAFTQTFQWTLEDLKGTEGKQYIPVYLRNELSINVKSMLRNDSILQLNTRRLTRDGRLLKVDIRVGVQKDHNNQPTSIIAVLRDVTMEDRIDKNREAINRISLALPQYPELRSLLSYITGEIKDLLKAEVSNVILLDENQKEFYFLSSAHDDPGTRKKIEKIRLSVDQMASAQVLKTGKPMIINESSPEANLYQLRDEKLGYRVKNVIIVPLRSQDKIIGILTADNKKEGQFDQTDLETLSTIAGTVALSLENAKVSRKLRKAYEELKGLNTAKDKMIHHLSHEIKTPVAILLSSLTVLSRRLESLPHNTWKPTLERAQRNLNRILDIQYEVDDIVKQKNKLPQQVFTMILDQCGDELESLIAEHTGEGHVIDQVREKIDQIFGPEDLISEDIALDQFIKKRIEQTKHLFGHRQVKIKTDFNTSSPVRIPVDPLTKIIDGLIRNAVENTPDQGEITARVFPENGGTRLDITDQGVGITKEAQKHIFEGFFSTQETLNYSSKRPYDFNAGGKGADLLRMKIFSERYHFKIDLTSERCRLIPEDSDICPGSKEKCRLLSQPNWPGCNGTTTVSLFFPS